MFYILQLSYCCFTLCYYPLELEIAGKNSKLLPLFCQNPVRLQSFVMDKPEIETITEKSQPGSVLSEQICILNWSHLMREASCRHTHCGMITKQHCFFPFLFSFKKCQKPQWEAVQGPQCCTQTSNKKLKSVIFLPCEE